MPRSTSTRREFAGFVAAIAAAAVFAFCCAGRPATADETKPELKIYMICDMEGTSGLFDRDQTWYKSKGVSKEVAEQGIKLMIDDVNSAVAAALKAGADRVIVCDVHGGGGNLRLDQMLKDPRVTYELHERSFDNSVRRWMPGLDATVSGVMLMGHHAKAGTPHSFLPHTSNPGWLDFSINGQSVGEIGYEACYAGHYGVPVILVHGDEALGREAEALLPGVVTACVKHAEDDTNRAAGLDPDAANKLVAEKIAEAIKKLQSPDKPAPYKPSLPMRVTIQMKSTTDAENASKKPGAKLLDAHTVECEVERHGDVIKWLKGDGAP
jgi:D-amino peptidase